MDTKAPNMTQKQWFHRPDNWPENKTMIFDDAHNHWNREMGQNGVQIGPNKVIKSSA